MTGVVTELAQRIKLPGAYRCLAFAAFLLVGCAGSNRPVSLSGSGSGPDNSDDFKPGTGKANHSKTVVDDNKFEPKNNETYGQFARRFGIDPYDINAWRDLKRHNDFLPGTLDQIMAADELMPHGHEYDRVGFWLLKKQEVKSPAGQSRWDTHFSKPGSFPYL